MNNHAHFDSLDFQREQKVLRYRKTKMHYDAMP